jgi:hypothetical protein
VDAPICFTLDRREWLTMDGVETNFVLQQGFLSANGLDVCISGPLKATPKTWGAIRAQYRQ